MRCIKIFIRKVLGSNSLSAECDYKNPNWSEQQSQSWLSLQVLELGGNRLQHLAKDTFAFLVNGFYLNLKANKISEVHSFAFRSFGGKNDNRHQISLEYNRLQFIDHILRVFQPKKWERCWNGYRITKECCKRREQATNTPRADVSELRLAGQIRSVKPFHPAREDVSLTMENYTFTKHLLIW